jgi:peptidoglycan-N-acetylglucosamine deacetylase
LYFFKKIRQEILKRCPGGITSVRTNEPIAALTFDDGPHPFYTPLVLEVLKKHKAIGTFFMVGEAAKRYPKIVKMVAENGHVIGNHSWEHTNFKKIPAWRQRLKDLRACEKATAPYSTRLFRPPWGAQNGIIRFEANCLGYRVIMWNVSVQDWLPQGIEEVTQKLLDRTKPGSIVLLHDAIYRSALPEMETQWKREKMLSGLDNALCVLKKKIHFVTVPVLLKSGRPVRQMSG